MADQTAPPQPQTADPIPDEVQAACMTLIAHMLNTNAMVFNLDLKRLAYEGQDLGDFEISIRRIRDPDQSV